MHIPATERPLLWLCAAAFAASTSACGGEPQPGDGGSRDAGPASLAAEGVAAPPPPRPTHRPAPTATAQAQPRPSFPPPSAGAQVGIPAGTLRVGSRPGTPDRRPQVEADLTPVDIPAFDIDALPYPNDPERPAQLAGTRAEAAQLCASRGRRLCHELEWERACRGDGTAPFPTGAAMDLRRCVDDNTACVSSAGVFDLGVRAPEWTASDAGDRLAQPERTAVARGGRATHSLAAHRCGTRHAVNPSGGGRALAVRCCGGDAPTLEYPDVGLRRMFRPLDLEPTRLREIMASVPEVARFSAEFEVQGEVAAARALSRGGASAETVLWDVAPGPFAWSPTPGEEVWIIAGSSGETSLLVALYPNPDGTFHHAASFVFAEPNTPIAVLRTRSERGQLQWSTCWSCGGENGTIQFGEDARVVIAQR